MYSRELQRGTQTYLYANVNNSIIYQSPKCGDNPSAHQQVTDKKMAHIHNGIQDYSAIKRSKSLINATT